MSTSKGTVKWFDSQKGFGFILRPEEEDLFVHYSALEMDGFKKLHQGDEVEYEISDGPKGEQASNVTILNKAVPVRKARESGEGTDD